MPDLNRRLGRFLNSREWRTFLGAVQGAATYPTVKDAVKSSQAWFSDGAARTSKWLLANGRLARLSHGKVVHRAGD
jgi:hypothetical protein